MARTLSIKDGKLEVKVDRPPKIRLLDRDDFNKQVNIFTKRLVNINAQIAELEKQKASVEASLAELSPFAGQL